MLTLWSNIWPFLLNISCAFERMCILWDTELHIYSQINFINVCSRLPYINFLSFWSPNFWGTYIKFFYYDVYRGSGSSPMPFTILLIGEFLLYSYFWRILILQIGIIWQIYILWQMFRNNLDILITSWCCDISPKNVFVF